MLILKINDFIWPLTISYNINNSKKVSKRTSHSKIHLTNPVTLNVYLPMACLNGLLFTASGPAYLISLEQNIPSIIKRKEKKEYGTKKMLEGKFEVGQNCLIIEDVISRFFHYLPNLFFVKYILSWAGKTIYLCLIMIKLNW